MKFVIKEEDTKEYYCGFLISAYLFDADRKEACKFNSKGEAMAAIREITKTSEDIGKLVVYPY